MTKQESKIVMSISVDASSDPNLGHYHWLYKALDEKQRGLVPGFPLNIGPVGEECDFLWGLLPQRRKRRFIVSPFALERSRLRRLKPALDLARDFGVTHVQFYDGDLVDFFEAILLAFSHRDRIIIYNFHWPLEWLELFRRTDLRGRIFSLVVRALVRDAPKNIYFSAETTKLSDHLQDILQIPVLTYPVMSAHGEIVGHVWNRRKIDLLLIPQNKAEIEFVASVADKAGRANLQVTILAKREIQDDSLFRDSRNGRQGFTVLRGPLDTEDYIRLLTNSKVVLLPYAKPYFTWGSSGKFSEAIAFGAFPFAPIDSAVCSQSPLGREMHGFEWNVEDTLRRVMARLDQGMPEKLNPVTFETFREWLPTLAEDTSVGALQEARSRGFISILRTLGYRPKGNHVRQRLLRFFRTHSSVSRQKGTRENMLPRYAKTALSLHQDKAEP